MHVTGRQLRKIFQSLQRACIVLACSSLMFLDARSQTLSNVATFAFFASWEALFAFAVLEGLVQDRSEVRNRPTDWTLVILLINCSIWGLVTAILMGAHDA